MFLMCFSGVCVCVCVCVFGGGGGGNVPRQNLLLSFQDPKP